MKEIMMDITNLNDAAAKKVDEMGTAAGGDKAKVRKQLLDKVRKHLWTLTCQTDVVEMTGVLEDFGGEKDVEGNLSKAVFGLLCIGAVFGVDVPGRIEKLAAALAGTGDKAKTATSEAGTAAAGDQGDHSSVGKKESDGAASETDVSDSSGSAKEQQIKFHEKNLRDAKTKADLDRVWKHDVTTDKSLDGKDKAPLYNIYKERRKNLGQ